MRSQHILADEAGAGCRRRIRIEPGESRGLYLNLGVISGRFALFAQGYEKLGFME
jgi:hypothetical protein